MLRIYQALLARCFLSASPLKFRGFLLFAAASPFRPHIGVGIDSKSLFLSRSTFQPRGWNNIHEARFPMNPTATQPSPDELIARGWDALPPGYRIPATPPTLEQAREYCRNLAQTHYENFHVATWFLPANLQPHFYSIYAYCRISDDLGDEVPDKSAALALLDLWGRELDACYEGRARHPVFVALAETIRACAIPKEPFADLLIAFRRDQKVIRYETMDDVLGYCRYSANPVGRLVLYACGEVSPDNIEENFKLSDATCSALQLANFWQDVSVDFFKGRVYIPQEDMRRFGVTDEIIANGVATPEFRALMSHEVKCARWLFQQGLPLIGKVNRDLALDLDLFSRGGLEILRAIERRDYDVLSARPAISKLTKFSLAVRALTGKMLPFSRLGSRSPGPRSPNPPRASHLSASEPAVSQARDPQSSASQSSASQPAAPQPVAAQSSGKTSTSPPRVPTLARAYAACRAIAKREAKNFYYAFLALPRARRNAICAIYAFMRQADDLADDESIPPAERRRCLDAWLATWHEVSNGAPTADPVFLAVRDATERYSIPASLLDELVAGVTLDLGHADGGAPETYATFADLYHYCYLVASVVGLVCIRIFGYRDLRAEKLAEETGIAFQLTNILRDVAEDSARNRVYLPLKNLAQHNVNLDALLHHPPSAPPTPAERELFAAIARLAEHYYSRARFLLPLVDPASRPALWVLVSIYHSLLKRIKRANYDVFSRRAAVPRWKKLAILAVGLVWTAWARIFE
jgi:squalene synthase HpnC